MTPEEMVKKLEEASAAYYGDGTSDMTDAEYDLLVDELRTVDPENAFLKKVGATPTGETFEHSIPVGSQEKLKSREEFDRWIKQVDEASEGQNIGGYVLQWKLDGITIVLYYEKGKLIRALTRGDGYKGEDVTANVLQMQNVKRQLPEEFTGQLRAEILLYKSVFEGKFAEAVGDLRAEGKKRYKNPRNTVAGLSRDQKKTGLQKFLRLQYFDIFGGDPKTELDRQDALTAGLGLEAVETKFYRTADDLWSAYQEAQEIRPTLDFEVDGVIVRANSLAAQDKMGMTSDMRPKGQKCLKFEAMGAVTKLESVELSIGHTGAIIPTGKLKPVEIGGVTVSSVLLNNYEEIERLDVAVGDEVLVIRAGDVIPKVTKVLVRPENRQPIEPPTSCIACGGTLRKDGAHLVCVNEECEGKAFRRLKSWVTKRDIKFLGDTLLQELYENHGIKEPHQLYSLTYDMLSKVKRGNGVVGSAANQILEEIEQSRQASVSSFLGSICIKFLGRRQVQIIQESAPRAGVTAQSLEDFLVLKAEDLVKVSGFGISAGKTLQDTKAAAIVEGIKKARPTIKNLIDAGVQVEAPDTSMPSQVAPAEADHPFAGKSMCFTGVRMSSDQRVRFGRLACVEKSGVSKTLDFLVMKDPNSNSSKARKARDLGVQTISFDEFKETLGV